MTICAVGPPPRARRRAHRPSLHAARRTESESETARPAVYPQWACIPMCARRRRSMPHGDTTQCLSGRSAHLVMCTNTISDLTAMHLIQSQSQTRHTPSTLKPTATWRQQALDTGSRSATPVLATGAQGQGDTPIALCLGIDCTLQIGPARGWGTSTTRIKWNKLSSSL